MAVDKGFHDYVMSDILAALAGVTSRAMFGGWGIHRHGKIFAIIADGVLYFKVDDRNRSDYERAGSKPFVYTSPNGKRMTMSYWELPDEVASDKRELERWVEKSLVAGSSGSRERKIGRTKKRPGK